MEGPLRVVLKILDKTTVYGCNPQSAKNKKFCNHRPIGIRSKVTPPGMGWLRLGRKCTYSLVKHC